jgi:hypothetical protein
MVELIKNPVFLAGIGRSGTTLFWTLFRNIPEYTAYYEPLDHLLPQQLESELNNKTDPIDPERMHHFYVKSYTNEYRDNFDLNEFLYRKRVGGSPLDQIGEYFKFLVKGAPKSKVAIKTVRMNNRLEILRHFFPECFIVYIWRDLNTHLISTQQLGGIASSLVQMHMDCVGDHFEGSMPFNDMHAACLENGKQHADLIVKYDDFMTSPNEELSRLLAPLGLESYKEKLLPLIKSR